MADEEGDPSDLSEEYDRTPYSLAKRRYTPRLTELTGPLADRQGSGSPSPTHLEASQALVRYNPPDRNMQHPSSRSPSPGPSTRGRQARTRSQSTQTDKAEQYVGTPPDPANYPIGYVWKSMVQELPTPD